MATPDFVSLKVAIGDVKTIVSGLTLLEASYRRKSHSGDSDLDAVYASKAAAIAVLAAGIASGDLNFK